MKHLSLIVMLSLGAALIATPVIESPLAEAAQTKIVKKKKKNSEVTKPRRQQKAKTNFRATHPNEPNGAAISDYCAHTLEISGRMGVGCNKYGRDFYTWDD